MSQTESSARLPHYTTLQWSERAHPPPRAVTMFDPGNASQGDDSPYTKHAYKWKTEDELEGTYFQMSTSASRTPESSDSLERVTPLNYDRTLGGRREITGETIADAWSTVRVDGRTYQGWRTDAYELPNDGEEQDRLDMAHAFFTTLLNDRLYLAPIESPRKVIDIATGTGIWVNELSEMCPNALIYGTDLAQIQPFPRTPKVRFIQEDSEKQDWLVSGFDLVHMRLIGPCFDDFQAVLGKAYANMLPGGWIELQDGTAKVNYLPGTTKRAPNLERFFCYVRENTTRQDASTFKERLLRAGFIDVKETVVCAPWSPWTTSKRLNEAAQFLGHILMTTVESYRRVLLSKVGLTQAQVDELVGAICHELFDLEIQGYIEEYFVYGRKP
ncbi:S-adenosyl-L-methionine-dependent methyltransferase [Xylariales sp. PMI_506]|nr:S-adenosyl-L-methionine-dependent methyltransferase [Xylariales sp. PMI_506]